MTKAHLVFIDNNPNLECYPTLFNKTTLHNHVLPLIITNMSELINKESYSINEITLIRRPNNIK